MNKIKRILLTLFYLLIVVTSEVSVADGSNQSFLSQQISAQPTPLVTPSTMAPSKNYTVPPLSSLDLKVSLTSGLGPMGGCGGLIYVKGGSGNDINLRVIDPQGKIVLDLGRISLEKQFFITPDETGIYTVIIDNEFSVFSSKEVQIFSNTYPDNVFEFDGYSISFLVIIIIAVLFIALMVLVAWSYKRKTNNKPTIAM